MIYQGKARYPVREAVLHCAATPSGYWANMTPFQAFATINRWHKERGFSAFGYHGLIMPDGQYYGGRPYITIGAHCIERNRGTLGFVLLESRKIDQMGEFDDWFKPAQRQAVKTLLQGIHGLERVTGHNDYAQKLCPGFKVQTSDWL